jgi:hypothetical protein
MGSGARWGAVANYLNEYEHDCDHQEGENASAIREVITKTVFYVVIIV